MNRSHITLDRHIADQRSTALSSVSLITVGDLSLSVFDVGLFVLVLQLTSSCNLLAVITQSTCCLSNSQAPDNPRTEKKVKKTKKRGGGGRSHLPWSKYSPAATMWGVIIPQQLHLCAFHARKIVSFCLTVALSIGPLYIQVVLDPLIVCMRKMLCNCGALLDYSLPSLCEQVSLHCTSNASCKCLISHSGRNQVLLHHYFC